jgi:hypothetical protein
VAADKSGDAGGRTPRVRLPKGGTEREVFDVVGYATRCTCTWDVELTFRVGDERTTLVRHFPERPLTTTGIGAADAVEWRDGRWRPASS